MPPRLNSGEGAAVHRGGAGVGVGAGEGQGAGAGFGDAAATCAYQQRSGVGGIGVVRADAQGTAIKGDVGGSSQATEVVSADARVE